MNSKEPFRSSEGARIGGHGSSLYRHGDRLDDERAASMADEGGSAGALSDASEQAGAHLRDQLTVTNPHVSGVRSRWLPWAIAGAAIAAFWLVLSRRR